MTWMRVAFLVAFILIGFGAKAAYSAIEPLFASGLAGEPHSASSASNRGQPTTTRTGKPAHAVVTPRPTLTTVRVFVRHKRVRRLATPGTRILRQTPTPFPTSTPVLAPTPLATATAIPTATALSGTVTLASYALGSVLASPGTTIAVSYTVNNGTGRTERLLLGASLKSTRSPSWATQSFSDPSHDAIAVVPPGVSFHSRFFTLPVGLRPGYYDAAWGLRDSVTGQRVGLVTAPAVLRVSR